MFLWSHHVDASNYDNDGHNQEVANHPMQRTISDDHRERLLKAGYIREVVDTHGGVSALALTGRGLRRLATINK